MSSDAATQAEAGLDKAAAWDESLSGTEEETPEPEGEPAQAAAGETGEPAVPTELPTQSAPKNDPVPLEMPSTTAATEPPQAAAVPMSPPTPARTCDERHRSLAETWLAGQEKPRFPTRLVVASAVFVGVFTLLAFIGHTVSNLKMPEFTPPSLDSLLAKPDVSRQDEWLKDALTGKVEERQRDMLPVMGAQPPSASAPKVPIAATSSPRKARRVAPPPPSAAKPLPVSVAIVEDDDETDPAFAEFFGSASRYEAGSKHPSSRPGVPAGGGRRGVDVRGAVLGARLQDEVSSDTMGAPVIAVLTRQAKVGNYTWPAGTEIHGEVASNTDTRIFVNFNFVRLADETTIRVAGKARDSGGRSGIPGKKLFNKQSAGSIGVSSATKMVQQLGHELAGSAGSILGAGIAGAGDSAADKAQRVDRDEYVVVVASGTIFGIYVERIGEEETS